MFKFMRFAYSLLPGLLAFNFILAACGPALTATQLPAAEPTRAPTPLPPTPTTEPAGDATPVSHGNAIGGYVELVDALRANGATVAPTESVVQPFFSVPGQIIEVNGADVQVYEYADEAAREAESSLITPDGQPGPTRIVEWMAPPNFWAAGRVLVLYVGADADVIVRLTGVLGEPITQSVTDARTYPDAVLAAIKFLSEQTRIAAAQIQVVSLEEAGWPDACLGLAGAGELCAEVITPGYRVTLRAGEVEHVFRTNGDGSVVRPETQASDAQTPAVQAAVNALAQLKGISTGQITVVSVEAAQWSDACLGVETPGIVCLQVITPGYRILLSADGAQYEFHTNETGSAVRLAP